MSGVVVNLGPGILANRIRGGGTEPVYVGWGIGAGYTSPADTALSTEVAADLATLTGTRVAGTSSRVMTAEPNDTWQLVAVLVANGGSLSATQSGTVTNVGLFDSPTIGSGTLFAKTDYAQELFEDDQVTVTFQCPVLQDN